jgi:hypothetical protein
MHEDSAMKRIRSILFTRENWLALALALLLLLVLIFASDTGAAWIYQGF